MSGAGGNEAVEKNKSNKPLIVAIAVLAVAVVAALIVVAVLLLGKNGDANARRAATSSVRTIANQENADDVVQRMQEDVEKGMFECRMSMEWTFENGKAESKDAYVANVVNNNLPFYFDVVLKGTNEVVYSSPIIPVGGELNNIRLDAPLAAGEYEATVMYYLLEDEVSQEVFSSAGFIITITVKN